MGYTIRGHVIQYMYNIIIMMAINLLTGLFVLIVCVETGKNRVLNAGQYGFSLVKKKKTCNTFIVFECAFR